MTKYFYKCLTKKKYKSNFYTLEAVQPQHIELIRRWRNKQMDFLRQSSKISKKEQTIYFETYVWPELKNTYPNQILFSFKLNKLIIGYGGLVNLSWIDKKAEMSFLLNNSFLKNDNHYDTHMTNFITLIKNITFNELNFNRLYTETYCFRVSHIKTLCANGFKEEGQMRENIFLKNKYYDSILHSIIKKDYSD